MKPNFLVIGAARSGTTSLFKYLEAHPDVFMSEVKEINFFSNERIWSKGIEWYLRHFERANQRAVGEASTSYTSAPAISDVPRRIREHLGKVKLIYMVRDPIDRLLSHYFHRIGRGVETRSLHEILAGDLMASAESLLWQGRYAFQIDQYLRHFQAEDLHVLSVDQLSADPHATVSAIFRFLGVKPLSGSDYRQRHNSNVAATRKSRLGRRVLDFYHEHVEQRPLPYTFKKQFLRLGEIGSTPVAPPTLSANEVRKLLEFYREDVAEMKDRFGIDVRGWTASQTVESV